MNQNLLMKNDIVFKAFFHRNQQYTKSFLSAILGDAVKIKRVMHDVRLEQLTKEMKYGVLDIDVELEDGEIVNIEMQLKDYHNIEKRTTFYASKKIVEQLNPNKKYEDLKKVIIIAILNYSLTDLPEYIIETERVITSHKEYRLNNEVKYYYIELDKFRKQNPDMDKAENQWLAFIDMERSDLLNMAIEKNEEIKNAMNDYEILTGDEEIKRLAEIRQMSELEEHSALYTATEKGRKEGIVEGKKEGIKEGKKEGKKEGIKEGIKEGKKEGKKEGIKIANKEMAEKLLKLNMPIEQIAEITKLSIKEIEKIR